jgi:adenylate cyclase
VLQTQFKNEFLLSDKLRATVLACLFSLGAVFAGINFFLFRGNEGTIFNEQSFYDVLVFLLLLALFELLCLVHITRHIKNNLRNIPVVSQYFNTIVEISSPVVIMLLLAGQNTDPIKVLNLPAAYIFFIFILLSTLRLNFKLTLFTGLLAGVEFFLLSIYLINFTGTIATHSGYMLAAGKSMMLIFCGLGGAFVSRQIRAGISRSLNAIEHEHKIINLFGQQISSEIVDEMIKSDGVIKSKLMKVCIMFIDIRNFTGHMAHRAPEEIVAYQNAFFSIVIDTVTEHNGIVNQFLGDGCMITFGAPMELDNPCYHAVRSALEVKKRIGEAAISGKLPPTAIGVGIDYGYAVTGNIGTEKRQQYSITGSVVILAARIEQLNKAYNSTVLISENVMENINRTDLLESEFVGKADVKGWQAPVGIYKIA